MRISVLGGGHGAYAVAAELSEKGHEVCFWRRDADAFSEVLARRTINGQNLCLVEIRTDEGLSGWGEGTTIAGLAYGEESPEGIVGRHPAGYCPRGRGPGARSRFHLSR
jgi:L-alanine-DL-glutamate epimerase-like enolase superfamily enzyme